MRTKFDLAYLILIMALVIILGALVGLLVYEVLLRGPA